MKVKVINSKQHFNIGNPKPIPILDKPNPKPHQVHFHENDLITLTQALVHECLTDGGMTHQT